MRFHGVSVQTRENLVRAGLSPDRVISLVQSAYEEDLDGGEDVTSVATISEGQVSVGEFRSRAAGVIAGLEVAHVVLEMVGVVSNVIDIHCAHHVEPGTVVMRSQGNTRQLLLAERTALNFLGHLSGIASLTRRWVDEVAEFDTQIRDTRKTTPGWRELEKYAVRKGGGTNHRMSLSESALIKDNHIEAAGGVVQAFKRVRAMYPNLEIEVEVDTIAQLEEIIVLQPDLILLDNMSVDDCQLAVEIVQGRCALEASGGLLLENAKAYAQTGVTYLAVGALTHSSRVLDIGLDLKTET